MSLEDPSLSYDTLSQLAASLTGALLTWRGYYALVDIVNGTELTDELEETLADYDGALPRLLLEGSAYPSTVHINPRNILAGAADLPVYLPLYEDILFTVDGVEQIIPVDEETLIGIVYAALPYPDRLSIALDPYGDRHPVTLEELVAENDLYDWSSQKDSLLLDYRCTVSNRVVQFSTPNFIRGVNTVSLWLGLPTLYSDLHGHSPDGTRIDLIADTQ
jgi:hypothetical protein